MANTKQAIKMVRKIKRRTQFNRWWKSRIKSSTREFIDALTKKDSSKKENAVDLYKNLQKAVDKAAKKGVIHKNKAARIKSSYSKKLASKAS